MMETLKSISTIHDEGFARGKLIASWIELPEMGSTVLGIAVTDEVSAKHAMCRQAARAEAQNREFPEFEATRHELNSHPDRDSAWQSFANGVAEGMKEQVEAAVRALGDRYRV